MARPKKDIDWKRVEELASYGSSGVEIAAAIGVCEDTFYPRFKEKYNKAFSDYSGELHCGGKGLLRESLWRKTLNTESEGNAQLLLFMARCILEMKEPESTTFIAPNQNNLDQSHQIMLLEAEIANLKEKLNAQQPQAE